MSEFTGPKSEIKHRHTRRAIFHDYRDPCIVMFTIVRGDNGLLFSRLYGDPTLNGGEHEVQVIHTPVGAIIQQEIDKMEEFRPEFIRIIKTVIMPDHVHLLLRVLQRLSQPITHYVSVTKGAITSRLRKNGFLADDKAAFCSGINDSLVYGDGQYQVQYRYICLNPYRALIKRKYPDLFQRILNMRIGTLNLQTYGNLFLLTKNLEEVHVRRKWTEAQCSQYKAACLAKADEGTVLISPFIHPMEREILKECIERGGSIIYIRDFSFRDRWKPSGRMFDLCAAGRLLLIAEMDAPEYRRDMNYGQASRMNDIALYLARNPGLRLDVMEMHSGPA